MHNERIQKNAEKFNMHIANYSFYPHKSNLNKTTVKVVKISVFPVMIS